MRAPCSGIGTRALRRAAPRGAVAVALVLWCAADGGAALARERLMRRIDQAGGLGVAEVNQLAQDAAGFIWVGNASGLYRYDGQELRLWRAAEREGEPARIACGPHGEVSVVTRRGVLLRVTDAGGEEVADDRAVPLRGILDAVYDARGGLSLLRAGEVLQRDERGAWSATSLAALGAERPLMLRDEPSGRVAVATRDAIWSVGATHGVVREWAVPGVADFFVEADGTIVALATDDTATRLLAHRDRATRELFAQPHCRGIAVVRRGDTYWVSLDTALAAVRPGRPVELILEDSGVPPGGPLLVDAEGSLWKGSFRGLFVFPEPETFALTPRDGLGNAPRRFFAVGGETWIDGWSGLGRLLPGADGGRPSIEPQFPSTTPVCDDARGTAWAMALGRVVERRAGAWRGHPSSTGLGWANACTRSGSGAVWIAAGGALRLAGGPEPRPRAVPVPHWPTASESGLVAALEDRRGTLWLARGEDVCHAPARDVAAGAAVSWTCERLSDCLSVHELVELPGGALWAATRACGVMRRRDGRWETVPGSRDLASAAVSRISIARSGGAWVSGFGFVVRVEERPDLAEGWTVLERPSPGMGLPGTDAGDVLETDAGDLLVASVTGLTVIPAAVRRRVIPPPRVALVEALVDGRAMPREGAFTLPYDRNRLELRFAALSYREPGRLRYQVRVREGAAWIDTRAPGFHFVDLPPGDYRAEVRASLDGVAWTPQPARLAFAVLAPWHRTGWAFGAYALALAGALYALHRARVAMLVRLERQRTRLAMDLHDELGSGLASVGILADIVRDGELDDRQRRGLGADIALVASELQAALASIVWALRPGAGTLAALAAYLADRGRRAVPGDDDAFRCDFPLAWPDVTLSAPVRRNVQLIAAEALANAVRHAAARRIVLGLAPAGRRWCLWVADDGHGLSDAARGGTTTGVGLSSMRRRAQEIGAALEWDDTPGGGTTVRLVFDAAARERRRPT